MLKHRQLTKIKALDLRDPQVVADLPFVWDWPKFPEINVVYYRLWKAHKMITIRFGADTARYIKALKSIELQLRYLDRRLQL